MRSSKSWLRPLAILLLTFVLLVFGAAVGARKWVKTTPMQDKQQKRLQPTDALPRTVSDIEGLEVVSAFIDSDGVANITILNHTGKTIIGLGISSGKLTFTDDNGIAQDNPKPLVAPYGSYTFQEKASNLTADQPIHVSAVLYSDGTEEGNADQRKNIHNERNRQKEKRLNQAKEQP
jgi:hypothetical protein